MQYVGATGNPLAYWLYPFARSLTTSAKPCTNVPVRGPRLLCIFSMIMAASLAGFITGYTEPLIRLELAQ